MKTSAGLLSLTLFLALPAAAQYASSSAGGHPSGSATSHGSASSASSGSSSGSSSSHATHSSYTSSSSSSSGSAGGGNGQSAGAGYRMPSPGRYIGNSPVTPVQRQAPIPQRSYARAQFVAAQPARAQVPVVRTFAQSQTGPRGPFITSVDRTPPVQSFSFGFDPRFHHGFHNSFCDSSFGFGSFNCFGGSFFNPFFLSDGLRYSNGLYYGSANYGYSSGEQVVDDSNGYEPPSAPGTYMPDALTPAEPEEAPAPKPVTLLQLKDGSMYGVTDYWLDHGQLRYVPLYGGVNSVPLERVDIEKTVELNSANGIGFNLRNAPSARPAPAPSLVPLQPLAYPDLIF